MPNKDHRRRICLSTGGSFNAIPKGLTIGECVFRRFEFLFAPLLDSEQLKLHFSGFRAIFCVAQRS